MLYRRRPYVVSQSEPRGSGMLCYQKYGYFHPQSNAKDQSDPYIDPKCETVHLKGHGRLIGHAAG